MGVFLSPALGIQLVSWSLADRQILQGPEWKQGRPTHYIFHSQVLFTPGQLVSFFRA